MSREKLCKALSYKTFAHKMLMKLTLEGKRQKFIIFVLWKRNTSKALYTQLYHYNIKFIQLKIERREDLTLFMDREKNQPG